MTAYLRNPLTVVWVFLTAITLSSWWIGRGSNGNYQIDVAITVSVLLIAAVKSHLVIRYFMEVRSAPPWLKWACNGWLIAVFALLSGAYWLSL